MEASTQVTCPKCNANIDAVFEIPNDPVFLAPETRGKIKPVGSIFVYRISSDQIKSFIIEKTKKIVPNAKVEVVPRYCEKKRRSETEPHHSYASLRIAFSEDVVEKKDDLGWFGKIGESGAGTKVVESLYKDIIARYRYNKGEVESWLKNYKSLEKLEESFGMTEAYIADLLNYVTPRRIVTNTKESWIFFSAAAENVISDMLTCYKTNKPAGKIRIQDVYPISKDNVEFLVFVSPNEIEYKENPNVRKILLGEEKAKRD